MPSSAENNKRIAKNTLLLYFRMLLMMAVSIYTSRVVLDKLGITDYGIYNVVGGIVGMLGFLSGAMGNAVQRFLSFEIGRGDKERVNHIFNVSLFAHVGIAAIVFVVMEVLGVWYLNAHMNIPGERLNAANWVLQCSIFTTLFTIVQVPYNAIIISKEQMGVYAYMSLLEVVLKLAVVYLLVLTDFDRLKLYSVLTMAVTIGILVAYRVYCVKKYEEARFRLVKDLKTLKEMSSFAGWNLLGELAWAFTGQGVNIILNLFFCPAINAARSLAEQVNAAVARFVNNFQTAVNPQIVKDYAAGCLDDMKTLLYRSIRFSYYLLLVLSMPLILCMDFVLGIWLKDVPDYTAEFCQLVLVCSMVSSISNPLSQVARAYGKIMKYQMWVSACLFLNFPLSYFVLKLGASPLSTMAVNICVQITLLFVRLYLTKNMVGLSFLDFTKKVLFPVVKVTVGSSLLPLVCVYEFRPVGWANFVIVCAVSLACSILCILIFGISANERAYLKVAICTYAAKVLHR